MQQQQQQWKLQQVERSAALNPELWWRGSIPILDGKPLSLSLEGKQFFFKATGCAAARQQHYRLLTPHALKTPEALECVLCKPALIKYASERDMVLEFSSCGLLQDMVWQWQPLWWSGRVDFMHWPTGTVIQVDGSAHFRGLRKLTPAAMLLGDIQFNKQAWERGGRVVRVHTADVAECGPLIQAALQQQGSFIALSPSYAGVHWQQDGIVQSYLEWLAAAVGPCCCSSGQQPRSVWVLPP